MNEVTNEPTLAAIPAEARLRRYLTGAVDPDNRRRLLADLDATLAAAPVAPRRIAQLEAKLAAVEALADEWQGDDGRGWISTCGDDLRDALTVTAPVWDGDGR